MDKKMYTDSVLNAKYKGYHAPEYEVTIGSKKFKDKDILISDIEVTLTSDGTAGGCRLCIASGYEYKNTSWDKSLIGALAVGAKLSIKLGYITLTEVFFGYVDDYTIEYGINQGPRIYISGLDGLGFLMNVRSRVYAGKKKVGDLVKQLLNDAVSAGAAQKATVGLSLSDMKVQRIVEGEDSYTFLNTLARQLGVQFFCVNGEIIFDKVTSFSLALMTLTYGENLYYFSKRLSVANQPSKVIVHGRDIDNKPIKGEVSSTTLGGDGKAASKIASKLLSKAVFEEESALVQTAAEAKDLAQNRFDALAGKFVFGQGECVGLPEIIPGRFIKIAGIDKNSCGSYFVTRVTHLMNEDGYVTKFEVRGAKSK